MKSRLLTLALALQFTASALAADPQLTVRDAWIRTAPPRAPLAGYMVLENHSGTVRSLVSARSSAFGQVTIHRTERAAAGSTTMTQVAGVAVPAHGRLVFGPGAYHLMLEQPRHTLRAGEAVPVVFRMGDGSALTVQFEVRDARATPDQGTGGHEAHSMGSAHGGHP